MLNRWMTALGVGLIFATSGIKNAHAQTLEIGASKKIGISGVGGKEAVVIDLKLPLYRIRVAQKGDQPCRFDLEAWNLPLVDGKVQKSTADKEKCPAGLWNSSTVFVERERRRAIHGLQVCLNSQKTRIKGLRVFASDLETGTPVRNPTLQKEDKLPNCTHWMEERRCAIGEVMVGMSTEVNFNTGGNYEAVGIAPICAKVTVKP